MKLVENCKTCSKPIDIQAEIAMGDKTMYVWRCGHIELRDKIILEDSEISSSVSAHKSSSNGGPASSQSLQELFDPSLESLDGSKRAYDFQVSGINFAETSEFNCLIADAMGLGKTIQALLTLKRNKKLLNNCLIVVKSSLIFQWAREFKEWTDNKPLGVMPILNRSNIIPGFDTYIISMDLLSRKGIKERLLKLGIKSIILDEVHNFKDPESARTRALISLISDLRTQLNFKPKIMALSGTPIKNRADEYFTILNLLAPEHFRSLAAFRRNWLIQNERGQYTRINPYYLDEFKQLTSRWIIRREKHEVLTNLPDLTRDYQFIDIEDPQVKESYNKAVGLFDNFLNNTPGITSKDILGWLARLRAITGAAKCQPALDFISEFTDSTDENIAIGIHHETVRDTLFYVMDAAGIKVLKFSGEDNSYHKERIVRRFESGEARVLVINMIAGGTGLNLQCCANALVLERQWNSADEEQFEGRFHRDGQKRAVKVTYMIANGTIDEFFHDMVERKRKILGETLSSNWSLMSDDNALKELTDKVRYSKL